MRAQRYSHKVQLCCSTAAPELCRQQWWQQQQTAVKATTASVADSIPFSKNMEMLDWTCKRSS
jgi:hypothetical protein